MPTRYFETPLHTDEFGSRGAGYSPSGPSEYYPLGQTAVCTAVLADKAYVVFRPEDSRATPLGWLEIDVNTYSTKFAASKGRAPTDSEL